MLDFRTTLRRIKNVATRLDNEIRAAFETPQSRVALEALFDRVRESVATLSQETAALPGAPGIQSLPETPHRLSIEDIQANLEKARIRFPKWTYWKHADGGIYILTGLCIEEATGRVLIRYAVAALTEFPDMHWTRTVEDFTNRFTRYEP